ncbi:MAG: hypothetical protein WBQ14_01470 [Gaiellaceae bacterium]
MISGSHIRFGLVLTASLIVGSLAALEVAGATSAAPLITLGLAEHRSSSPQGKKLDAKIAANLASASLTAAQARKVKLSYSFSRSSKTFTYRLDRRVRAKWSMLRSVTHKGKLKGSHILTVRALFAGKAISAGHYRLRLSADGDSTTLGFEIIETIPLTGATAVSAGGYMVCALLSGGTVDCWGFDAEGELGNGRKIIVPPYGLPTATRVLRVTNATVLSAGGQHTCSLLAGTVDCWGFNGAGQLGNNTLVDSSIPVSATGLTTAVSVASGNYHSCALLSGGTVDCWGYNRQGQLGNGTWIPIVPIPRAVVGLTDVVSISAGGSHTCALLSDHTIKCWGEDWVGEIGDGENGWRLSPVPVNGITNAAQVSAGGFHTCALLQGGTVDCWGFNLFGQLGNGTWVDSSVPAPVAGLKDVVSISAGGFHTCALLESGAVNCWGNNDDGQLGNGSLAYSNMPTAVKGITNAIAVSAGLRYSCALLSSGKIKCWGANKVGGLGDGTTLDSSVPVGVSVLK